MKKICIITKIAKNFGALLQGYALKTYLERKGYEVNIVYFSHKKIADTYKIFKAISGLTTLKYAIISLLHLKQIRISTKRFLLFREENFNLTSEYNTIEQLRNDPPEADIYITGSDQVWNPRLSFDPAYYLGFGKDDILKISYAASMGLEKMDEDIENEFKNRLTALDMISVRENNAKSYLETMGIASVVSLDPTLLLTQNDYNLISVAPPISGPYILCYFMSVPRYADPLVKKAREKLNMPIISIRRNSTIPSIGEKQIWDAGPAEFLGLFKNASYVITSSFHGTVFSIIYRKPFISTLHALTGSRTISLLENLGLENRIVREISQFSDNLLKIDYSTAERKLACLQQKSEEYIDSFATMKKGILNGNEKNLQE